MIYYGILLALVALYSAWLFSFTLLDSFSTFSNDAADYVLVARKWSPYFTPSPAEIFTWPVHTYPPGLPVVLALTGMSESLWAGHFLVSMCMLAGVLLFAWWVGAQVDRSTSIALLLLYLATPGVIIHTMGILSENLYIVFSFAALVAYSRLLLRDDRHWPTYVAILLLVIGAIMTRTIGIALATALLISAFLDRRLHRNHRAAVLSLALLSLAGWQLWEWVQPHKTNLSYDYYLDGRFVAPALGLFGLLQKVLGDLLNHAWHLVLAWKHYFFLGREDGWFFFAYYFSLIFSALGLLLRVLQFRMDALYVLFYLGIVLLWGFPGEMSRFLHPVALILVAQPFLYFSEQGRELDQAWMPKALSLLGVALAAHLLLLQADLFLQRQTAQARFPQITHSFDYYSRLEGERSTGLALAYRSVMELAKQSAVHIPPDAVVSAVKSSNYALLADRRSVFLTARVSPEQQWCNFKVTGTSAVFLSNLTSPLNLLGPELEDDYSDFTLKKEVLISANGEDRALVLLLDRSRLEQKIIESGYNCLEYREME